MRGGDKEGVGGGQEGKGGGDNGLFLEGASGLVHFCVLPGRSDRFRLLEHLFIIGFLGSVWRDYQTLGRNLILDHEQ